MPTGNIFWKVLNLPYIILFYQEKKQDGNAVV